MALLGMALLVLVAGLVSFPEQKDVAQHTTNEAVEVSAVDASVTQRSNAVESAKRAREPTVFSSDFFSPVSVSDDERLRRNLPTYLRGSANSPAYVQQKIVSVDMDRLANELRQAGANLQSGNPIAPTTLSFFDGDKSQVSVTRPVEVSYGLEIFDGIVVNTEGSKNVFNAKIGPDGVFFLTLEDPPQAYVVQGISEGSYALITEYDMRIPVRFD